MDSHINPLTGDYSRTSSSGLENAIYLRVSVPLGSYWADSSLGSKLHLLRRNKDLERNRVLAVQYTREALQPLIDDKRADRIDINAIWNHDGRLNLLVDVWRSGILAISFTHYVKVS